MTILALEFSSGRRSAAVRVGEAEPVEVLDRGMDRVEAFGLMDRVLARAGVERREIGRLAIGIGPGSFTGIRIAIAIAQGWQLATGVEVVSVNALDCLVHEASLGGCHGPQHFAVDAQRGEFAVATHAGRGLVEPVMLRPGAELAAWVASGCRVLGPGLAALVPGAIDAFPTAAGVARLAASAMPVPAETLEPVYLRPPAFAKAPPPALLPGV